MKRPVNLHKTKVERNTRLARPNKGVLGMATTTYGTTTPRTNTTMYWVIGALAVLVIIAFFALRNREQIPAANSSRVESTTTTTDVQPQTTPTDTNVNGGAAMTPTTDSTMGTSGTNTDSAPGTNTPSNAPMNSSDANSNNATDSRQQ